MMIPLAQQARQRPPRVALLGLAVRLLLVAALLWVVFPTRAGGEIAAAIDGPVARQPWLLPAVGLATVGLTLFAVVKIGYQRRAARLAVARGRS